MYINIYTRKIIISYIFLWGFSFSIYYLSWLEALLDMWGALIFYSVVLFLVYALWKFLHGREQVHFFLFFISFLYKVSLSLAFFCIIVWSFFVYQNELRPAKFPLYTLSNWEKILHFQTVSHIASESFYLAVRTAIIEAKNTGAVLFFEWVQPGSKENMEAFNRALWIDFSEDLYDNFSRLYGVRAQDNLMFLGLWNTPDINVDIDIDTIMELYRARKGENYDPSTSEEPLQIDDEILRLLWGLKARELALLQYANQAFLNFFMKQEALQGFILEQSWADIFSVILEDRDKYIADAIRESEYENIFAIYGKLHFDGVWKHLQTEDPRWKIQHIKYTQVIDGFDHKNAEQYRQLERINQTQRETLLRHIQSSEKD